MNTYIDIIGLTISLSLFFVWIFNKKIGLFNEKMVTMSILACVFMQAASLKINLNLFNHTFDPYFYKASLIFAAMEVCTIFILLMSVSIKKAKTLIYLLLVLISAGLIFVSNAEAYPETSQFVYLPISSNLVLYGICSFLGLISVIFCIANRKRINVFKRVFIYVWFVVTLGSFALDYFFPSVHALPTSFLISLIAFISIDENIEKYYDTTQGSFQYDALLSFLKDKFLHRKSLSLIYIYAFNDLNEYSKEFSSNNEINDAITFLKKTKGLNAVKIESNELIVCSSRKKKIADATQSLKTFFDEYQANLNYADRVSTAIVYVEDIHIVHSVVELFNLLTSSRNKVIKNALNASVVTIDNSYVEKLENELETLKEIDYAIENNGVILNYQPIYSISRKKVVSVEVLSRIKSSKGTIIPPGQYLPVAEKYGKIVLLGEVILKKACEFFNNMNKKGIYLDEICVNFSSYQLEDSEIINSIIDAVSNNKISPKSLCIEITNVERIKRRKDFIKNVEKLSSFGITISINGYGKDNSGLEYLTELPADIVRLDRNFVWRALSEERTGSLLKNITDLTSQLKTKIVAVGIENEDQFTKAADKGVDYIQGAYIGMPMDEDSVVNVINTRSGEQV